MALDIKVTGSTIQRMVKALKVGVTAQSTKVILNVALNMGQEDITGKMEHVMTENGLIIKSLDMAFTPGQTVENMLENGKTTVCMEKDFTLGKMVVSMKANISLIRSMATAFTLGVMAASMLDTGRMVNSMEKETNGMHLEEKSVAGGKMASALNGFPNLI